MQEWLEGAPTGQTGDNLNVNINNDNELLSTEENKDSQVHMDINNERRNFSLQHMPTNT